MAERPILFSGPMVRAILEGRKTQTRRIVKLPPASQGWRFIECAFNSDDSAHYHAGFAGNAGFAGSIICVNCPYGKPPDPIFKNPGDRLWVREGHALDGSQVLYRAGHHEWNTGLPPTEGMYYVRGLLGESLGGDSRAVWVSPQFFTWGFDKFDDPEFIGLDTDITPQNIQWKHAQQREQPGDRLWVREGHALDSSQVFYRAGHAEAKSSGPRVDIRWRPSIFMPRWASRITLEITGVRVERLQQISGPDCWEEGISHAGWDPERYGSVVECYRDLWQSIYGPGSYDANPWVWVVEFRRLTPPSPLAPERGDG